MDNLVRREIIADARTLVIKIGTNVLSRPDDTLPRHSDADACGDGTAPGRRPSALLLSGLFLRSGERGQHRHRLRVAHEEAHGVLIGLHVEPRAESNAGHAGCPPTGLWRASNSTAAVLVWAPLQF